MPAGGCARQLDGRRRGHSVVEVEVYGNSTSCRPEKCCIVAVCAVAVERETAVDSVLASSRDLLLAARLGRHGSMQFQGRRKTGSGKLSKTRRTSSLGSFPVYVCVRATTSYPTTKVSHTFVCVQRRRFYVHSSKNATVRCIWLTASAPAPGHGTFRS